MQLVDGEMLWTNQNNILYTYPYLTDNLECEVVIVGAGIVGCICAYYFIEAGINTILIDKGLVGFQSTAASTSILEYEIDYNLYELNGLIGEEKASKAFKLCQQSVFKINDIIKKLDNDCNFSFKDSLYYSESKNDMNNFEKEYKLRKELGFDVELIRDNSVYSNVPKNLQIGILTRNAAGDIDPYKFCHYLLQYCIKKGLKVFENTEVIDTNNTNDNVTVYTNKNKNIQCKKVVIATGYEAKELIKDKIVNLTRSFTIATKPIKDLKESDKRFVIRDNNDPYYYLRFTKDNRIIFGGEDLKIGGQNSKISNGKDVETLYNQKFEALENRLKNILPKYSDITVDYKFTGIFGDTKDGLPYLGEEPNNPNYYFDLCYGSNGILYAILGGEILKDLYLGNKNNNLEIFKFNR